MKERIELFYKLGVVIFCTAKVYCSKVIECV